MDELLKRVLFSSDSISQCIHEYNFSLSKSLKLNIFCSLHRCICGILFKQACHFSVIDSWSILSSSSSSSCLRLSLSSRSLSDSSRAILSSSSPRPREPSPWGMGGSGVVVMEGCWVVTALGGSAGGAVWLAVGAAAWDAGLADASLLSSVWDRRRLSWIALKKGGWMNQYTLNMSIHQSIYEELNCKRG